MAADEERSKAKAKGKRPARKVMVVVACVESPWTFKYPTFLLPLTLTDLSGGMTTVS